MSSAKVRQAATAFQEAGLNLLESIDDRELRKFFALRMRCLQAAVAEFADHVIQRHESQRAAGNEGPEF